MYYLQMYRAVFAASQEEFLRRYFSLSIKDSPSELESEELEFILELACHNPRLSALIYLVDRHLNEVMISANSGYVLEIEQSRGRALERILCDLTSGTNRNRQGLAPTEETLGLAAQASLDLETGSNEKSDEKKVRQVLQLVSDRLLGSPPIQYCAKLIRINPVIFSRQCLLCLTFSALGAICSTYRDDISHMAKMLLGAIDLPITQMSLTQEAATPANSHAAEQPIPSECRNELVTWTEKTYDGRPTFYEEIFKSSELTVAHAFLPPGSRLYLKNEANHDSVVVEVNEKLNPPAEAASDGTQNESLRVSHRAAQQLNVVDTGVAPVTVERVEVRNEEVDRLNETQRSQLAQFKNDCGVLVSYTDDF